MHKIKKDEKLINDKDDDARIKINHHWNDSFFFWKIFAEHPVVPRSSQTDIHGALISTLSILLNPSLTYPLL